MTEAFRVLVTGSRTWPDYEKVEAVLSALLVAHGRGLVVVHGDCPRGADAIARAWCLHRGVADERHPADWSKGRGAGYARNAEMVMSRPDECVAFVHDRSRGATHCAGLAERTGIPTRRWTL